MQRNFILIAVVVAMLGVLVLSRSSAQERPTAYEYVTVRWAGKEHTHLIRPGGKVEFIGAELRKMLRVDRADERSFYLNVAMNGLAREGYEFAGMTSDEIVMKRPAGR
jgi:hypothetical protein